MPTLAELNAQAARTRLFLEGALEGGSIQGSKIDPKTGAFSLLSTSPFTDVGRGIIDAQVESLGSPGGGATVGAPSGSIANRFSPPSNLLLSSGSVSRRFDTSGVDSRGIPINRPNELESSNVQLSTSGLNPILEELLNTIISGGGTPGVQAASTARTELTGELQNTISALTPEAAQALSESLVDDIIRTTLDEILPQLQAASESAGTSQNALTVLSFNDLATRTAEKAAIVAVETITGFAGAQAGLGAVVERLTALDPLSEQLIALITGTPAETSQASGPIELLNALGLLPEGLDPSLLNAILGSGTFSSP